MAHTYYSQRKGSNPNQKGLPLADLIDLFGRVFSHMREDGYFHEAFGFECVDAGDIAGKVRDIEHEILLSVRKKGLWPIDKAGTRYSEDDFFDVVEFLFQHVSKPIDGTYHSWGECGTHWETFNQAEGRVEFRDKVNAVLAHYEKPFELSSNGEVLHKPEAGFEPIFDADIPSKDSNVVSRIECGSALLPEARFDSR